VRTSFTYTAREAAEAGLMYYRARYYNPGIGRFAGEDPLEYYIDINFYRYVKNNPIISTDPLGLANATSGVPLPPITVRRIPKLIWPKCPYKITDYSNAANYCQDTNVTGGLHPGQTCFRQTNGQHHVCFDNQGGCDEHWDQHPPCKSRGSDGKCTLGGCIPGVITHNLLDVLNPGAIDMEICMPPPKACCPGQQ
jgi:RHS repeat-associated protein